jgi:hypothetical protein
MYPTLNDKEQVVRALRGPQFDREQHGSLFDRGSADSYYSRLPDPHWYPEGSYNGDPMTKLTLAEREEYMAGYDYNEQYGHKKSWD